jgi:hypothetical protein
MNDERDRLKLFRALRGEIRGSSQYLVAGIDVSEEKHHSFYGTANGKVLRKRFVFENRRKGFESLRPLPETSPASTSCRRSSTGWPRSDSPSAKLLTQVDLDFHLLELVLLGLDPVDVLLFVLKDRLEKLLRAVVSGLHRCPNGLLACGQSACGRERLGTTHIRANRRANSRSRKSHSAPPDYRATAPGTRLPCESESGDCRKRRDGGPKQGDFPDREATGGRSFTAHRNWQSEGHGARSCVPGRGIVMNRSGGEG